MVAEHRDLRSGRTIWQEDLPGLIGKPLTNNISCDVVIIGGGVSGALLAEELSKHNFKIILLERRGIAQGSTAASTALVEWEIDTPLIELAEQIGKQKAQRAWLRSFQSVKDLAAKIRKLDIACDYVARKSLYLAGEKLDGRMLKRETMERRKIGLPSRFLNRKSVLSEFGIKRDGAILSRGAAELNPVKLTVGLIKAAVKRGVTIYEPEEATGIECAKAHVTVSTKEGHSIRTKYVVFATGYEIPKIAPRAGYKVVSTWAIASKPQRHKLWPGEVLISEASEPYLYIRTTPDGRVMAGGEDEFVGSSFFRRNLLKAKTVAIKKKIKLLLPNIDPTAEFAWTGAFGITNTGLPFIGRIPENPRCFAAMGFGGNGTTFSMIAATLIAGEIIQSRDVDASIFAFRKYSWFDRMRPK